MKTLHWVKMSARIRIKSISSNSFIRNILILTFETACKGERSSNIPNPREIKIGIDFNRSVDYLCGEITR